jgi:hypothetical protein
MIDFQTQLIHIIEERQTVLFEIERVLFTQRYKLSQKHMNILSVHSISMLYSIWEGYIQQSFQLYIKYLNSLNIDFICFSDEIITFHMENTFKQLSSYPQKTAKKIHYFSQLQNHFSQQCHVLYSSIDTESNVSFKVLNKILCAFSLEPFSEYWGRYKHPQPNLKETLETFLRYRNGVAHGGDISSEEKVTQEVYEKYKILVVDLMYAIHDKIMYGINNRTYLNNRNNSYS